VNSGKPSWPLDYRCADGKKIDRVLWSDVGAIKYAFTPYFTGSLIMRSEAQQLSRKESFVFKSSFDIFKR
jgi:hypothetical protein